MEYKIEEHNNKYACEEEMGAMSDLGWTVLSINIVSDTISRQYIVTYTRPLKRR